MDYEIMKLDYELSNKLQFNFDENDMDLQEEYFDVLNKIIDGVLLLRYDKYKNDTPLSSPVKINNLVLSYFNKINNHNKDTVFEELEEEIHFFINMDYEGEKYYKMVQKLYTIYISNNRSLPHDKTSVIYNRLLNEKQDVYISKNKKNVIDYIIKMLPLTDKKKAQLITTLKLKDAKMLIEFKSFNQLGVTEEEIRYKLKEVSLSLNHIKPFNKEENRLTATQLAYFTRLFLSNSLNFKSIHERYPNILKSAIKKILSKYNQILLPYLDNISVNEKRIDYKMIQFNHNHLKVLNKVDYNDNLDSFILKMSKKEKQYLVSHLEELKDVLRLLPLATILSNDDFFNINTFKSMVIHYDKIRSTMIKQEIVDRTCNFEEMLDHFKEFLRLAIVYQNADSYTVSILGGERVEKITLNNKNNSCNSYDYVNAYIEMLKEESSFLPPISFEIKIDGINYKIESGNNYDLDRLLLGKNVIGSCIGPGSDGEKAFYRCLTKEDADLFLVKEVATDNFLARGILFRIGNTIVMAPIYGRDGLERRLYSDEFLGSISNAIIEKSREAGDNIDYILLASCYCSYMDNKYDLLVSYDLENYVPHCDVNSSVNILYNKKGNVDSINYNVEPYGIYEKTRKKIEIKEKGYSKDIMRIRALYLLMTRSKEKLQEEVCMYKRVYVGQDFYIGVLEDDSLDSIVLPINSVSQKTEIDACLNDIVNKLSVNEDSFDANCLIKQK